MFTIRIVKDTKKWNLYQSCLTPSLDFALTASTFPLSLSEPIRCFRIDRHQQREKADDVPYKVQL
jgi:hypothetical protein